MEQGADLRGFYGGNEKYRVTHCARTDPLPLLPSGPGGVGGVAPRRTRHCSSLTEAKGECRGLWIVRS